MQSTSLTIINKLGLHARAAAKLSGLAEKFSSDITIQKDNRSINAKSIMQIMMLAASKGTEIAISADGADEVAAIEAITELVSQRFDEDE